MFNERASKEYIETQFQIEQEIEKLQDMLAEHNQVSRINWAHVGDVKHVLQQLKQINGEE